MSVTHLDYSVLSTLRDVMEGEYPTLLDVFIKDSEQRVLSLHQALKATDAPATAEPDLQQLGMMAHSFKGSSSNMGATHLADLCRQLEELARSVEPVVDGRVRALVTEVDREYGVVRELFDAELQACFSRH